MRSNVIIKNAMDLTHTMEKIHHLSLVYIKVRHVTGGLIMTSIKYKEKSFSFWFCFKYFDIIVEKMLS